MPTLDINQNQFERFQKFAEPFVDSHESAFEKVLNLAETMGPVAAKISDGYGLTNLPDLKHTTVIGVRVGSKTTETNYWNSALIEFLKAAKGHGSLVDDTKILPANISAQKKTIEGYKWYPDLGLSVQGLAASGVAKTILSLAGKYGIPMELEFFWQDKPEAAKPGQKGKLVAG